ALRVWGDFSVPISNSPCNMIHSVVSSTSAVFAKLSLPLTVTPFSAGVLMSRTTSLPASMVTLSPATGTLRLGQVAGSDHFVAFTADAPGFWACTIVNTLTSNDTEINDIRRNERFFFLMTRTSDTLKNEHDLSGTG